MKKSNIWIRSCVHLLLYITVAAYSSEIGNPITDDIRKISLLKQNIPKDYKITVHYLPKEVSGMCWVKLNVFHLEESLKLLAEKFGNISSNKDNIGTFVQMLREIRYHIGNGLENAMFDFECHYREVKWLTGRYFEFVEDFFNTANSSREDVDCEPPPCPTIIKTSPTPTLASAQHHSKDSSPEWNSTEKEESRTPRFLPETLERGLLSLLFIPLIAVGFLLIWKVKSRRTAPQLQRGTDGPPLFIGVEASTPTLEDEMSEKNRLNIGAV
ncbi:kit ligand a isoform X2 [Brachyhypopomus gauderio]|uniref:kit ligand a isoform X2 n=1 Tax=Brachyhypopomus gauderio TaxID=698409 RepID=UPI004042CA81